MCEFVGYRVVKGQKDGKDYCFRLGIFLQHVDERFGLGLEPVLNRGRLPIISDDFFNNYKFGTKFKELLFDSRGAVVSGIEEK